MQDPKNSHTRRRWYQRAIEATTLWKALSKPIELPMKNMRLWKTREPNHQMTTTSRKLRKCTSTRAAASSSFSHVCLCAPISEVFQASVVAPRRPSFSYARSRSMSSTPATARMSVEGRRIFRGKSLTDDVLMRRFVVDEEAMRRRNEMEVIRKRSGMRITKIGPSPLSRMVLAHKEFIN